MVDFAGYDMPVQYPAGIIKEHLHCRASVGLFDVSHMGQFKIEGKEAKKFLETMTVADIGALTPGKATLSLLMNDKGGIVDDCIITKVTDNEFFVVLNAGCVDKDVAHLKKYRDADFKDVLIEQNHNNALLAI